MVSPSLFGGECSGRRIMRSDLNSEDWRAIFDWLEAYSLRFVEATNELPLDDYWWPADPLHCWSRIWEYPFVWSALRRLQAERGEYAEIRVADIGAAVTFFTFLLLENGFRVECVDIDKRMPPVFERVRACLAEKWEHPLDRCAYHLTEGVRSDIESGAMDAVTCISVLEHTEDPAAVVEEMARICRPNGLLVVTLDLSLAGAEGLTVKTAKQVENAIRKWFEPAGNDNGVWVNERVGELLTNWNSPNAIRRRELVRSNLSQNNGGLTLKQRIRGNLRKAYYFPNRPGQEISRASRPQRFIGGIRQAFGSAHAPCLGVYCGVHIRRSG